MTQSANTVFLLGAGFSADFGIPTMRPFFQNFLTTAHRKYPQLTKTLDQHIEKFDADADLESLLTSLNSAVALQDGLPKLYHEPKLRDWIKESELLRSHLISYIIETCENFDKEKVKNTCGVFFTELYGCKNISFVPIFTTNYDRVVEFSCDAQGISWCDGFEHKSGQLVSPWNAQFDEKIRLAKLHGSVTWYVDRSKTKREFLRLDRGYPLPGPEFRLSRSGVGLEPLMILPTLEKGVLAAPYTHLMELFSDIMSQCRLLIAIGTSMRDAHIVGTIEYNAKNIICLLVDIDPRPDRLEGVISKSIRASASDFLSAAGSHIIDLIESIVDLDDKDSIYKTVEEFADQQTVRLEKFAGLSDDQKELLGFLSIDSEPQKALDGIAQLSDVSHPMINDALLKLVASQSTDVRSAAVGRLGSMGFEKAVPKLEAIATGDADIVVQTEAILALQRIGGQMAHDAIERVRKIHPENQFIATRE